MQNNKCKILKFTLGQMDLGIYALEQAEHFWPEYSKAERIVPVTTELISALL